MENRIRKLTAEEAEKIVGGEFDFNSEYDRRRDEARIKCPVCGAESSLKSIRQGYDGFGNDVWIAVEDCFCTKCRSRIVLFPEEKTMAIQDEDGLYGKERFPFIF